MEGGVGGGGKWGYYSMKYESRARSTFCCCYYVIYCLLILFYFIYELINLEDDFLFFSLSLLSLVLVPYFDGWIRI